MIKRSFLLCLLLPSLVLGQLANVGGNVYIPRIPSAVSAAPTIGTDTVDADGEGVGIIFQMPYACTINKVGVRTGTLTTSDAGTVFRLESVSLAATPAVPNGIVAAGATTTVNVAASNTWYEGTLGTPYLAAKGELIAATVTRPASGTLSTVFSSFGDDTTGGSGINFPFFTVNAGAGWVLGATGPGFAIGCNDGTYLPLSSWPILATTTHSFGSGSTPDVVGNVWIPSFKCRVSGVWAWLDLDGGTLIKFYDTDGVTVLATATLAANTRSTTGASLFFASFDATVTPTVGSTYRIGIEPSSATTLSAYSISTSAAAVLNTLGFGTTMYLTTAKDPTGTGSWTNTTANRAFLGVIIDQLDAGASSGGGAGIIGQ